MQRLVVLCALLSAGTVGAEELQPQAQPATSSLKLVAIMLDTQQVMLWNDSAGEYQLARVGDEVDEWRVISVVPEAKRAIVLKKGLRDELYLVQMPRANGPADPRLPRIAPVIITDSCGPQAAPVAAPAPTAPMDPYAQAAPGAAPINPYATAPAPAVPPPTSAPAPVNPYVTAPAPAAPLPTSAPVNPYAAPAPAAPQIPIGPPPPAPLAAPAPVDPNAGSAGPPAPLPIESHSLTRTELNRELRDFDRLLAGITVAQASGGGFVLTRVEPRSWIAKIGLRPGDVVRTIAGETVSTIEDAARVYARLGSLDSFLVIVERGQQKLLLSYSVK